jgi:tetratricopeptide (TPR) repeat protein
MTASYEEAAGLYERLGDRAELAEALYNLAFPSVQSRSYDEGERLARRSEELYAELGDEHGVARALWLRSLTAAHAGHLDEAEDLLRRAVGTFRATADTYYLGWALRMLGRNLIMQGRLEEARGMLDEGLANFARDDISAVLLFMSDHAALAGVEGDPERQVRIMGAMQRMQRATGTDLVDDALNEPLGLEASLAALGDRAEVVRAEGAAMDDDEAIRYTVGR